MVPDHPSEFIAPGYLDHRTGFIKIHCPFAGPEHFMNGVERRSFVLQFGVQSVVCLLLGDIDRHASVLQQFAFGIPVQHPLAAKPPDRPVFFNISAVKSGCPHDVFIMNTGTDATNKRIPIFRMNTPHEWLQFIWKIMQIRITQQPA